MSRIQSTCHVLHIYKCINILGSEEGHVTFYLVCLFVSQSLPLVRFGQLLRYPDNCIVNIMKVYIERNNLQVELIRFCNFLTLFTLLLRNDGFNYISILMTRISIQQCRTLFVQGNIILRGCNMCSLLGC